ncbi:unnamed protein product, partial [Oikopleura dioica]
SVLRIEIRRTRRKRKKRRKTRLNIYFSSYGPFKNGELQPTSFRTVFFKFNFTVRFNIQQSSKFDCATVIIAGTDEDDPRKKTERKKAF